MKVTVIPIKFYLSKNILIKLDHINLKKPDTWKIQLTIASNFILSIDNEYVMLSKSDNIEITISNKADEVIK